MGYNMSLNKIDIYMETNTKIEYKKYTFYKSYIVLKNYPIKECILETVRVNCGHCGRFIP